MNNLLKAFLIFFTLYGNTVSGQNKVDRIINELEKSNSSNVLVAAHRGDWRNAPENSLKGIENCIQMGVDIVEIDIQKTKDNQFILMHDKTIDRMTNGKGNISDYTLKELKQFYLKDHQGRKKAELTNHRIPTLEESLLLSKDRIMLNLDKAYRFKKEIYPLLVRTETEDLVIFKTSISNKKQNFDKIKNDLSLMNNSVFFMPIIKDAPEAYSVIKEHIQTYHPVAMEMILSKNDSLLNHSDYVKNNGTRVWVNTLWSSLCAGYSDAKSLKDPDANWGHIIRKGANIIQTDNPVELLQYLQKNNLRQF